MIAETDSAPPCNQPVQHAAPGARKAGAALTDHTSGEQPPGAASLLRQRRLVLAVVWLLAAAYAFYCARRGWIPHDEGTLGQSAERVLQGQVPHVGYDEPYTGGVSVLHAAAFRILGVSISAMRLTLWALFLCWIPAIYYTATRIARPVVAGGVTALAAIWSIPTYASAMPSWYNMLFAGIGVAALFAHLETARRRWLFAAGLCGGLAILAKITGLYFVAAVLLALTHREQTLDRLQGGPAERAGTAYRIVATTGILGVAAAVQLLIRGSQGAAETVNFVVPPAILATYLVVEIWRSPACRPSSARFAAAFGLIGPFLLGVCVPLAAFALPYVVTNTVGALAHGVFGVLSATANLTRLRMPPVWTLVAGAPLILWLRPGPAAQPHRRVAILSLALLLTMVFAFWRTPLGWRWVLLSARATLPLFTIVAPWELLRQGAADGARRREQIFALASVTALCSLIQFPFAGEIYFFYAATFVPLLAVALLYGRPTAWPHAPALLAVFYAAIAVFWVTPNVMPSDEPLGLERAGIRVTAADARTYVDLVEEIRRHAKPGDYVFAEAECPEVTFLSGTRSPTRNIFRDLGEGATRTARTLAAIRTHDVRVVVINTAPIHRNYLAPDLVAALRGSFPLGRTIGKFEVRWHE